MGGDVEMIEDPMVPTVFVSTETCMKLNTGVEILGILVLVS